jgi:hypothetical protein
LPTLKAFQSVTLAVEIPCGEDPLRFEFYPAKFTRQLQERLRKADKAVEAAEAAGEEPRSEDNEGAASILVAVFASWNLTDEKGKPCECSVRFLVDELGYFAIGRLLRGVYSELDPGKNGAGGSLNGSAATH